LPETPSKLGDGSDDKSHEHSGPPPGRDDHPGKDNSGKDNPGKDKGNRGER
jgi:hypothetical protein